MEAIRTNGTDNQGGPTAILGGLNTVIDALVRDSLARIDAERLAALPEPGPGLLDRNGACEYLAVGKAKLKDLVNSGEFKPIDVGAYPKYIRADLDRYIERERRRQHGKPR